MRSRDAGRRVHRAQFVDEVFSVIGLVGAEGDRPWSVGARFDPVQRRDPVRLAVSTGVDDEAVAVLHQCMTHEAQLGFLPHPLR